MILGMFMVMLYSNISRHSHSHEGRGPEPASIIVRLKTALGYYEIDNGSYPRSLNDLIQKPTGMTNWHGPYLDPPQPPIDPWGHNYFYEFPGKHNTNGYDLSSAGPDGKKGNYDDIGNW